MPTNHRFNTEGHSPAAVLLVGVVQLGYNLEIYSTKKLDSGNLENLVPRKIKRYTVVWEGRAEGSAGLLDGGGGLSFSYLMGS